MREKIEKSKGPPGNRQPLDLIQFFGLHVTEDAHSIKPKGENIFTFCIDSYLCFRFILGA